MKHMKGIASVQEMGTLCPLLAVSFLILQVCEPLGNLPQS